MCTKQLLIAMTAVWMGGALWAQQGNADRPAPPPQGQQPGVRGRAGGPGGGMGAFWQLRQFDTNGDMLIDEKELNDGLDKAKQRADEAYAIILKTFDANGDSKITGDEENKVREFVGALMTIQQYDRNRDWQIDENEMKGAFDQLADAAQRLSDGILQRFDKDADGKLSPEETNAAKAAMQQQWQQGPQRGGQRPGGDRAPGQPPAGPPAPAGEQKAQP